MPEVAPAVELTLTWNSGLAFTARDEVRGSEWAIDGANETGPSPVVLVGSAVAGCMAIDVVHILTRGRFDVRALTAEFDGFRAETDPRRYTRIDLHFLVDTSAPADSVARAIQLSRDKYCSVWQSLRQDIEFTTSFTITAHDGH
jgi:putative redox protein